jgi:hypothetical protein
VLGEAAGSVQRLKGHVSNESGLKIRLFSNGEVHDLSYLFYQATAVGGIS